jgi:hypothetical protein
VTPQRRAEAVLAFQDELLNTMGWMYNIYANLYITTYHMHVFGRTPSLEEMIAIRGFAASRLESTDLDMPMPSCHAMHLAYLGAVWKLVETRLPQMDQETGANEAAPTAVSETGKDKTGGRRKRKQMH